ncbi:hypothetical protein BDF14DRAFT_1094312 [Spinellus fusiger]|nr:hypothetical protein BDF14DRAFT_1094312 [Spinellus fusiger]
MLPQFGYIVAQAGADSHPHPPTVIPPPLTNKQQRSPLPFPPVHHPRSPKEPQRIAPQPTLEDPSFYTIPYYARHHSSPPPPLPPPPPTAAASAAGTASTTAAPPPSLPSSSSSSASTATTTTTTTAQAALTATGTGTSTGATTSAATSVATGATNSHHSHHNHLPPPIPYMYAPSAPPTDDYYSKSSYYPYDRPSDSPQGFQSLQTYPPISPWQEPKLSNDLYRPVSSIWHTPQPHHDSPPKFTFHDHDDPYHPQYGNQWQDEPTHVHHDKMLSRLRGFNELMAWMDSEFIEQSEE